MVKTCINIGNALFEDLKKQAIQNQLNLDDLIVEYIQQGLISKEAKNMHSVNVPNEIMEKIDNRCKELNCNPEKLIHSILFDYLKNVESIPSTVDCEKIMMMLEQDNPKGDNVLKRLKGLSDVGWD